MPPSQAEVMGPPAKVQTIDFEPRAYFVLRAASVAKSLRFLRVGPHFSLAGVQISLSLGKG